MTESIDQILDTMKEPQRTRIRQRILALIQDLEARDRADWDKITKLKDARAKKKVRYR